MQVALNLHDGSISHESAPKLPIRARGHRPGALATPHIAGVLRESDLRMSTVGAQSVVDVLNGSWEPSVVVNGVYSGD